MRWGLATSILVYVLSNQRLGYMKSVFLLIFAGSVHYFSILFAIIFLINREFVSIKLWLSLPVVFYMFPTVFNTQNLMDIFLYIEPYSILDLTFILIKLNYYFDVDRTLILDNIYNLFNVFTLMAYVMACFCVIKSIDITVVARFIPPFCILLCLYFVLLPVPIFSRRIMLLLLVFSAPIFVCLARYFKPTLFVVFVGLSLSFASFINIGFVKELIRIF